ncbi:metabotropic glutamate receptor 8-like [Gordionus sp. m RMFG-2023]|uniref:metabotropic glutamate receptor 8-like n=1 Tax=Gordionus sp. m RMFG-2023 TaxID=3053472 RepID=UPI0031FD6B1E
MVYNHENTILKDFPLTQLLNLKDINVGGLYDIYQNNPNPIFMCSNELNSLSILKAYSMIYMIDILNKKLFIPSYNISIGYFIVPTCFHVATTQIQCIIKNDIRYKIGLVGLIGPSYSQSAFFTSPLLSYYKLPHISPEASAVQLKGRKFNYLFQITSNQIFYLNAILSLLQLFRWNEILIIYSPIPYFAWFRDQMNIAATRDNFCIWLEIEIKTARVALLFISDYQFEYVINLIHSVYAAPNFIYIGIDSWPSTNQLVKSGLAKIVEGAITISQFGSDDSTHYSSWLSNRDEVLTTEQEHQWYFGIKDRLSSHENNSNTSYMIKFDKTVSLSMDATMALLYSIDDLIKNKCYNIDKMQMKNCIIDNDLKTYIQNLSFYGLSGKIEFGLDRSVNNPLKIGNFLEVNGVYDIFTVGNYNFHKENGSQLKLITNFRWRNYTYYNYLTAPTSRCSAPCKIDELQMTTSSKCCWICRTCFGRTIFTASDLLRANNFQRCISCPIYKWPSLNKTVCVDMPNFYIRDFKKYWKIIIVLSSMGIIFAISMVIFYVKHYQTTPFKLEFQSLLYLQYVGIFFGFISVFLITNHQPNEPKCGAALFFYLLSISLIFGALLSKQSIIIKRLKINKPGFKDVKYEKRALIMAILIVSVQESELPGIIMGFKGTPKKLGILFKK